MKAILGLQFLKNYLVMLLYQITNPSVLLQDIILLMVLSLLYYSIANQLITEFCL